MLPDIIGLTIAAALGVGVAYLNFCISKYMLRSCPDKFVYSTVIRTLICVVFLALVYFIGSITPCDIIFLLLGAAFGSTLPTVFFTKSLLSYSKALSSKDSQSKGKEVDTNG